MKNYKRFAVLAMAATMAVGSGLTAMAAETADTPAPGTGGATGTGDYEGYVEETSVFTVDVPTDASSTQGFNFFVDPNNLLSQTNYARISGAAAADFESGATLFFTRTPNATATPAVVKYGKDSEKITLTNKSSYEVNVEVSATVTGADKFTLGEISTDTDNPTTDPTISLAIVSGDESAPVTADGGTLTGKIEGVKDNFSIQWDASENKYKFAEKKSDDATRKDWKTYSFNLTGACGGDWTADQAEVEPKVELTWKVTDPKATPAGATTTATSITAGGAAVKITIPDGVTITTVEKTKADGSYNALPAEHFTWDDADGGKNLTLKTSFKSQFGTGKKIKISFSTGDPIILDVQ